MYTIELNKHIYAWNSKEMCFTMSEKGIPFATKYTIRNPKTGANKLFTFKYSTGPEFDPSTKWIYETSCGIKLEICNDATMTAVAARKYLGAKLAK
jgi:hypothetical protein